MNYLSTLKVWHGGKNHTVNLVTTPSVACKLDDIQEALLVQSNKAIKGQTQELDVC